MSERRPVTKVAEGVTLLLLVGTFIAAVGGISANASDKHGWYIAALITGLGAAFIMLLYALHVGFGYADGGRGIPNGNEHHAR